MTIGVEEFCDDHIEGFVFVQKLLQGLRLISTLAGDLSKSAQSHDFQPHVFMLSLEVFQINDIDQRSRGISEFYVGVIGNWSCQGEVTDDCELVALLGQGFGQW
ncbi:hypothetical protein MTP99_011384 [Tenebrio molitor]|nr:hypothetical protein MTP99_011384 [Tenebrio molitor]